MNREKKRVEFINSVYIFFSNLLVSDPKLDFMTIKKGRNKRLFSKFLQYKYFPGVISEAI